LALRGSAPILLLILLATSATALASSSHSVTIYFNGGCYVCVRYVDEVEQALRSIGITDISKYDYGNATAFSVLSRTRERLGVPREFIGSATTVIDGKYIFEGYLPADIIVNFVASSPQLDKLIVAQGLKPETYRLYRDSLTIECKSSQRIVDCLSSSTLFSPQGIWALVLFSGLIDGLNPCAFAVLAYFIAVLSIRHSRKEILEIGAVYILSVYLVYLGIGIGLTHVVLSSGFIQTIAKALGVLIIIVGLLNLSNIFQEEPRFQLKIPKRLMGPVARRFSRSWIERSAIVAALMFGGIVSALEFPCTGGIYAAIIGILSVQRTDLTLTLYLLGYNFAFVMPLIILLILSCNFASFPAINRITRRHRRISRTASGLLMLSLGLFLLLH